MPRYRNIKAAFDKINRDAFGNQLPKISISYRLIRNNAGEFRGTYRSNRPVPASISGINPEIRIARRFGNIKSPEWIFWGLLLHEMVHYYLWYKRIKTPMHGKLFKNTSKRKAKMLVAAWKKDVTAFY